MADLNHCLIIWLNSNELKSTCSCLEDLSDGVILYELLNLISPDYFDLEYITKNAKQNWALKLGNLRKLKRTMDKYSDTELKSYNPKYDAIDLPIIARTQSQAEIIKLLEYVILIIVNCPTKHIFVKRIMELDEDTQMQMMFFIQKVMESQESTDQQQEIQKKELDSLKSEKKRLSLQVENLEQELTLSHEEYSALNQDYQQILIENERLLFEMKKKSSIEVKEQEFIEFELMAKMSEKDEIINELKKSFERTKKKYEQEIYQLKDEVDISSNKLLEAANNEKLIVQYKKRLENFNNIKNQLEELLKENQVLNAKVSSQNRELEALSKVKQQYAGIKESFEQEKIKSGTLTFSLESKEKQIRKLEKSISDSKDRISHLQNKLEEQELKLRFDLQVSEDSINGKESPTKDYLRPDRDPKTKKKLFSQSEQISQLTESIQMTSEDYSVRLLSQSSAVSNYQDLIDELQNNNFYLSEEIQKLADLIKEKESALVVHEQVLEELKDLKSSKQTLHHNFSVLAHERETLAKKLSDLSGEVLSCKSELDSKEIKIKDLQDLIKELESEPKPKDVNSSISLRPSLSSDRISDLQQRIKDLMAEKIKIIEESKSQVEGVKAEYEKLLKQKDEEMVNVAEDATRELMNHREQLVVQLQSERRNSIMTFQRAMSIRENPMMPGSNKEVFKLREVLMEKEKEISKLQKNNKELKKCWNQTAKLLKAVWKELGKETEKIEEAVKDTVL